MGAPGLWGTVKPSFEASISICSNSSVRLWKHTTHAHTQCSRAKPKLPW